MTDLRTAAQAVDEAIFRKGYVNSKNRKDLVLIEALRKALAAPVEPVAWLSSGGDVSRSKKLFDDMGFTSEPLYTTPPSVDALIAELDVLRQQPSEMHSDHEKLLYAIADIADKYRSNK